MLTLILPDVQWVSLVVRPFVEINDMNGHDPTFIENRIRWRARQYGIPFENTDYWKNVPKALGSVIPGDFTHPILFSMTLTGEATVIGTAEVAIISNDILSRFNLDDITHLSGSHNIGEHKPKLQFDSICINVKDGKYRLPTEAGKPCFAVWNILLMLVRMQRKEVQHGP